MFGKPKRENPYLDQAIDEATRMLDSNDKDFLTKVEGVERLYALKDKTCNRPSPDTLAIVAGNLFGIFLILHYEQFHPIASKAMGSLLKPK